METELKKGEAKVADVGCGHGASTLIMAKAYAKSKIIGFDYHKPSVERARKEAEKEHLRNVSFEVAGATDYPGDDYGSCYILRLPPRHGKPIRSRRPRASDT